MRTIDLRSHTATRPGPGMRRATAEAEGCHDAAVDEALERLRRRAA